MSALAVCGFELQISTSSLALTRDCTLWIWMRFTRTQWSWWVMLAYTCLLSLSSSSSYLCFF